MAQLTFAVIPGFVDVPDSSLAADQPLTDYSVVKISNNAKFAVVRKERIYMGFYRHGDVVLVPVSPVDGYAYARSEIQYDWKVYATHSPTAGFAPGQQARPPVNTTGAGPGNLLYLLADVDDATGLVFIETHYYVQGGAETATNDGVVKVYAECQRLSLNVSN